MDMNHFDIILFSVYASVESMSSLVLGIMFCCGLVAYLYRSVLKVISKSAHGVGYHQDIIV